MKQLQLLAVACAVLLFTACTKDKNDPTPTPSNNKIALITDAEWKWTDLDFEINMGGTDTIINGWSEVQACDRDDIITFTADGTGQIDEMATKCDPADPQIKTLTWELIENETKVKVIDNEGTHIMTILELTASTAKYKQRMLAGADSVTVIQTFTNVK